MDSDFSDEETVEETYLLVEFAGNTGDDALKQENVTMRIVGVDTEQPLVQIGNQLYAGEYSETFGTELIFTEVDNDRSVDPVFENKLDRCLEYMAKTTKKLIIKRAFATPKNLPEDQKEAEMVTAESGSVGELLESNRTEAETV
jgi:general transcription factor 3C polypeptide 6